MKRFLSILVAAVLAVTAFSACKKQETPPDEPTKEKNVYATLNDPTKKNTAPKKESGTTSSQKEKTTATQKSSETNADTPPQKGKEPETTVKKEREVFEQMEYDSKEDVALYIKTFGKLPPNYIKQSEFSKLVLQFGSVEEVVKYKCIGGDVYANKEGLLPAERRRVYRHCDIGVFGSTDRGSKRIVYSNDGLIYYTEDWEQFELLYGNEK